MTALYRDEILEPDPELELLHDREYRVRAFRKGKNLLIRGAVRDQKPPGLYFAEDDEPLTIHHMQVDLEVSFPDLVIVDVQVTFQVFPNATCPGIVEHYDKLVGLSIARGFTHKVRELFGGPRGCSHTTALLQAMAPVAVQCFWSMSASHYQRSRVTTDAVAPLPAPSPDTTSFRMNLNTCHVWDDDGEFVQHLRDGGEPAPLLFVTERLRKLGREQSDPRNAIRRR